MTPPTLVVREVELDLADPWKIPNGVETFELLRTTDGSTPLLPTSLAIFRSGTLLHALFVGADDHLTATMTERDDSLYEEDAVEVFLAPGALEIYYEFEANPLGALFDARIDSPDGDRHTMKVEREWNAVEFRAHVRRTSLNGAPERLEILMTVPLAEVDPQFSPGSVWRANFFRIDRKPGRRAEFTAWSPTLVSPADFHVPARFGTLRFE